MPVMMEVRTLRFGYITPTAERQIEELHPRDKNKVVNTLKQALRLNRCERMKKEKSIWRVRVTDSLRISCCRVNGVFCVVHVGMHADSDHFVDHANGSLTLNHKPLKESTIMKRNAVVSTVKTEVPNSYAAPEMNGGGWRDFMERGIKGLVDHVMIDDLETIRELATDQIKDVRKELDSQVESITKLASRLNDLATNVEQSKAEQGHQADELAQLGLSLRAEAKRQGKEIAQNRANAAIESQERDRKIAALDQKLVELTRLIDDRFNAAAAAVQSQVQPTAKFSEEVALLRRHQEQAGVSTRELAAQIEQLQVALPRIDKEMMILAENHGTITSALAEIQTRQAAQAARPWNARWKRWCRAFRSLFAKQTSATYGDSPRQPLSRARTKPK